MASNVVFNGVTYSIPADGDNSWGPSLTAYFISIASNALQKTGGTFTLTAEAAFGATFGLKAPYFKSYATNPAAAGAIRLGNTESVSFRNFANSADLALTSNASDALLFNSKNVLFSGLALIVNADIHASAAIAVSKLAALGVAKVVQTNATTGFLEASAVTNTTLSYLDATSSIQTQINTKAPSASPTFTGTVTLPATVTAPAAVVLTLPTVTGNLSLNPMTTGGDLTYGGASGVEVRLANGAANQYLKSNGTTVAPSWATFTLPTIQKFTSGSGTYTTPANVKYIQVRMVGGGGGGGGAGTGATAGTAGGNSTFGTTLLVANGGALGTPAGAGAAGGTASLGTGPVGLAFSGGSSTGFGSANTIGGTGGNSAFGGGGGGANTGGAAGLAAAANSGSGGGGASSTAGNCASGAGAGGFVDALITTPLSTYAYAVGAAGSPGGTGTGGGAGGAGSAGIIIVTEFYQ